MTILNVLTVCGRPENLPQVAESLLPAKGLFDLRWYVWFTPMLPREERTVCYRVNSMIDSITDGWIYFLDDDNAFQAQFFVRLHEVLLKHPDARAFVCGQHVSPRVFRSAETYNMCVGAIDAAQVVLRRDLIGDARFPYVMGSDGLFIIGLWKQHPEDFVFTHHLQANYNALTWGSEHIYSKAF